MRAWILPSTEPLRNLPIRAPRRMRYLYVRRLKRARKFAIQRKADIWLWDRFF